MLQMARTLARRQLARVLAGKAEAAWRRLPGPALLVLTYHRVLPDGHPDRAHEQPGMYVRPETLDMHLRTLREHFELVHLDDWLECARGRQDPAAARLRHHLRRRLARQLPARLSRCLWKIRCLAPFSWSRAWSAGTYSFWPNRLARQLARTDKPLATSRLAGATAWRPGGLRRPPGAAGAATRAPRTSIGRSWPARRLRTPK